MRCVSCVFFTLPANEIFRIRKYFNPTERKMRRFYVGWTFGRVNQWQAHCGPCRVHFLRSGGRVCHNPWKRAVILCGNVLRGSTWIGHCLQELHPTIVLDTSSLAMKTRNNNGAANTRSRGKGNRVGQTGKECCFR